MNFQQWSCSAQTSAGLLACLDDWSSEMTQIRSLEEYLLCAKVPPMEMHELMCMHSFQSGHKKVVQYFFWSITCAKGSDSA